MEGRNEIERRSQDCRNEEPDRWLPDTLTFRAEERPDSQETTVADIPCILYQTEIANKTFRRKRDSHTDGGRCIAEHRNTA